MDKQEREMKKNKKNEEMPESVAVVISTYNNPEFLQLCLFSLCNQTCKPDEVVIADDGSTDATRHVVSHFEKRLPIKYVWQEDKGFRKAMIMNKAFALCQSEYIIQVDGDIIMGRHFVEDHMKEARRGCYLNGSRGKFDKKKTDILKRDGHARPHFFSRGLHRRLNAIRIPFLTPLFYQYKKHKKVRGCNLSFWRKDLFAVNGYDNGMVGYGTEDIDLPARLERLGVMKRFVKFKAIEFHLHHREADDKYVAMSPNHQRFVYYNEHNVVRVDDGISRFMQ